MEKVKCTDCGEIGFTAAPRFVKCSCGGALKIIPFCKRDFVDKMEGSGILSFTHQAGAIFSRLEPAPIKAQGSALPKRGG